MSDESPTTGFQKLSIGEGIDEDIEKAPVAHILQGTKYEQGAIWFEDGNVVLVAEDRVAFRVYRGILSMNSEVFSDMFASPQPPGSAEWEGCPIVHLSDTATDILHLLTALHRVQLKNV